MLEKQLYTIGVEGMTCTNCALSIKKLLEKKGLDDVNVSFPNKEATFLLNTNLTKLEDVKQSIENLGFKVLKNEKTADINIETAPIKSVLFYKLLIGLVFTLPLLLFMFLPFGWAHHQLVQLVLCLPVFIIGVWHFGKSAYYSLKSGIPNMDVLIIIGSTAAFIYSLFGLILNLGHNYMFWETTASIITFVLLGNYIEHLSINQTTTAIKQLLKLQPEFAIKVNIDDKNKEHFIQIPIKEIQLNDVLLVKSGQNIPADGVIVWGEAQINESMMTGESSTITKALKNEVIGGTIVQNGTLKIKATRIGKDTTLSQIIQLVKKAQNEQPPIHKLADKISAVFVPTVLAISVFTFLLSVYYFNLDFQSALLRSIAVLVIACPCAMGLATPTAIMVGIGRAAKNGILIKGGNTLEIISKVKTLFLDKTGTLTTGKFIVQKFDAYIDESEFVSIVLALEQHSTHPIAKSICAYFNNQPSNLTLQTINEIKGLGIEGVDKQNNTYKIGSYTMAKELTNNKEHTLYLIKNNILIGHIDMDDALKPEAKESINQLKQQNIELQIISGDTENKVKQVAKELQISKYFAQQTPIEKLQLIDKQKRSGITLMLGDGINDAPALAKADIGVSLSNASEIAIQTAQVILLGGSLLAMPKSILIAKHTLITVKQNLFWAFIYNILAIPLAALGYLNPMVAALTMALSDVIVIGNSIRLKYKKLS